jgi:DNA-binding MarR family transcriptional regulator/N-acetylglutamate synthase-like GNAT family acetyltransferase
MSVMREIGSIARSIETISNVEFREINLEKGQYILVIRICENRGINQETLSNMVNVDRTTISKAIKKLEVLGYVEKRRDKKDRRAWKLFPTQKAMSIYDFLKEEEIYTTQKALDGLTAEEINTLEKMLMHIRKNIVQELSIVKNGEKRDYLKIFGKSNEEFESSNESFKIIEYENRYQSIYAKLNLDWLIAYDLLEEKDLKLINNIEQEVLDKGGKIFLLQVESGEIIGTIGLVPVNHETVEIIKLSISDDYTGKGFGKRMVQKAIDEAYNMEFKNIILYTNSKLKAAIKLYEKMGFELIDIESNSYELADLKMIYKPR